MTLPIPEGYVPFRLQEGGYAMVTHFCEAGPKGVPPYIYGPMGDVYPIAHAGEVVLTAASGFDCFNRKTMLCHALPESPDAFAVKILYVDDLVPITPVTDLRLDPASPYYISPDEYT